MLGQEVSYKDYEPEKLRSLLLMRTAGFKRLLKKLKLKHKLKGIRDSKNKIVMSSFGQSELKQDIEKLAIELDVTEQFLEDTLSGWVKHKNLDYITLPIYAATGEPFPDGFYIKVGPHTTIETVKESYKVIKLQSFQS